jgi:hypothetical protein
VPMNQATQLIKHLRDAGVQSPFSEKLVRPSCSVCSSSIGQARVRRVAWADWLCCRVLRAACCVRLALASCTCLSPWPRLASCRSQPVGRFAEPSVRFVSCVSLVSQLEHSTYDAQELLLGARMHKTSVGDQYPGAFALSFVPP